VPEEVSSLQQQGEGGVTYLGGKFGIFLCLLPGVGRSNSDNYHACSTGRAAGPAGLPARTPRRKTYWESKKGRGLQPVDLGGTVVFSFYAY